jgi:hypothetical protein
MGGFLNEERMEAFLATKGFSWMIRKRWAKAEE